MPLSQIGLRPGKSVLPERSQVRRDGARAAPLGRAPPALAGDVAAARFEPSRRRQSRRGAGRPRPSASCRAIRYPVEDRPRAAPVVRDRPSPAWSPPGSANNGPRSAPSWSALQRPETSPRGISPRARPRPCRPLDDASGRPDRRFSEKAANTCRREARAGESHQGTDELADAIGASPVPGRCSRATAPHGRGPQGTPREDRRVADEGMLLDLNEIDLALSRDEVEAVVRTRIAC